MIGGNFKKLRLTTTLSVVLIVVLIQENMLYFLIKVDMDFNNAAGFMGKTATAMDGQFVVYYFSHAMLFCAGVLMEPHVVLTPAACVYGEDYKFTIFAGTHKFLAHAGAQRYVENICFHGAYNHSDRCSTDNIALLVLNQQFSFRTREPNTEFNMNRVRYGVHFEELQQRKKDIKCNIYGWGSRRNGFLLPLLIEMRKMEVKVLDSHKCDEIWNTGNKYLCLDRPQCTNEKYGALCPDDLGSVLVCGGYVIGLMTSRLIDRPCGVGFLNVALYHKFFECAVDDSRDVMEADMAVQDPPLPEVVSVRVGPEDVSTISPPTEDCAPEVTYKSTTANKFEIYKQVMDIPL